MVPLERSVPRGSNKNVAAMTTPIHTMSPLMSVLHVSHGNVTEGLVDVPLAQIVNPLGLS
jgi:hypothetical protein